jgi:hypothetical protein
MNADRVSALWDAMNSDYWITLGIHPFSVTLNFGYIGAVGWYLGCLVFLWVGMSLCFGSRAIK